MTLDELIHQPTRLQLMAALAALSPDSEVEFTYLRDLLGLTDGNLSAHLLRLEEAGYIRTRKTFVGRKPAPTSRSRRAAAWPSLSTALPSSACSPASGPYERPKTRSLTLTVRHSIPEGATRHE